jgi:hypothetical protein
MWQKMIGRGPSWRMQVAVECVVKGIAPGVCKLCALTSQFREPRYPVGGLVTPRTDILRELTRTVGMRLGGYDLDPKRAKVTPKAYTGDVPGNRS